MVFAPTGVLALLRSLAFRFTLWGVGVFEEACSPADLLPAVKGAQNAAVKR